VKCAFAAERYGPEKMEIFMSEICSKWNQFRTGINLAIFSSDWCFGSTFVLCWSVTNLKSQFR
jgi:hypothetical protein